MANRIKNDKGFLVIEMTPDEAINVCNFGVYKVCNFLFNKCDC